jgi:hypothetical protein
LTNREVAEDTDFSKLLIIEEDAKSGEEMKAQAEAFPA